MKARVEAGDLWHAWKPLRHRLDRREVVRLMEGGQRYQRLELVEDLWRDESRAGKRRAAMHDTVPDAQHARTAVLRVEPRGERIERRAAVADGRRIQRLVGQSRPVAVPG